MLRLGRSAGFCSNYSVFHWSEKAAIGSIQMLGHSCAAINLYLQQHTGGWLSLKSKDFWSMSQIHGVLHTCASLHASVSHHFLQQRWLTDPQKQENRFCPIRYGFTGIFFRVTWQFLRPHYTLTFHCNDIHYVFHSFWSTNISSTNRKKF